MATRDVAPQLPRFADGKKYILSGRTLNRILEEIRLNRPVNGERQHHDGVRVEGGGTAAFPVVPGSTTVTLSICVDGEVQYLTINGFISLTPP